MRIPSLKILDFYILISAILFVMVKWAGHQDWPAPDWVYHHLNDFLCIPIVAYIALKTLRFFKRNPTLKIGALPILGLVIYYAFYFEYLLPFLDPRHTADFIDVICYFLGGGVFYFLQRIEIVKFRFTLRRAYRHNHNSSALKCPYN